jgi:CBS domain-containing protein
MKRTISDLMKQKDFGRQSSIDVNASIDEALALLEKSDVGALLVMDRNVVVGVFSERDFARAYTLNRALVRPKTKLKYFMSQRVIFVTADYRLDECMAVMVKMKIRHLPVLDGDTPIAFLSMRHIMEALVEEKQFMVNQLVTYITGTNTVEENRPRGGLIKQKNRDLEKGLL